mgnify:CR=1 FL=1
MTETTRATIVMERDLWDAIRAQGRAEGRSTTQQAIVYLKREVARYEANQDK